MSEQKAESRPQMTPEELAKRKAEIQAFHKEQIPFLKQQLEYEDLLTAIEDSRARRAMAIMRVAQIMAGPEQENLDGPEPQPPVTEQPEKPAMTATRTLKKD